MEDERESANVPEVTKINWISYDLGTNKPENNQNFHEINEGCTLK